MGKRNGIIHLCDLPSKEIYIKLKGPIQMKILKELKNYGTFKELERNLGVSKDIIRKLYEGVTKSVSLHVLQKISRLLIGKTNNQFFEMNNLEKIFHTFALEVHPQERYFIHDFPYILIAKKVVSLLVG